MTGPASKSVGDGRRAGPPKPLLRGWLHLVWFTLSLVAGTLLVIAAHGPVAVTGAAVYSGAVTALFGVSALYHRVDWGHTANRVMQRIDHLMIFVLIAGTATPMYLLAAPGLYGRICLILTWALAASAAGLHLVWMDAPERLVGGTYIGLGAVAGLALPPVWLHAGPLVGCLIAVGGLLYGIGALAYHRRWPDPAPTVFGYHEVFHVFVCVAAACHYVAVAAIIASEPVTDPVPRSSVSAVSERAPAAVPRPAVLSVARMATGAPRPARVTPGRRPTGPCAW